MRRLREFFPDRWFELLLWVRYDLSWPLFARGIVAAVIPLLVVFLALPFARNVSNASSGGSSSPVTLPVEGPDPLRVSPLRPPVVDVLVVGDSLVAGEEDIYQEALWEVGVSVRFDAAVSRGLRYGWLCPSGSQAEKNRDGALNPDGEAKEDGPTDDAPADVSDSSQGSAVVEDQPATTTSVGGSSQEELPGSGCVRQGLETLTWHASVGDLPGAVVVALGTNDASYPARQVLERLDALRVLLSGRQVFLLETATYPMTKVHAAWNDTARTWCLVDISCRFVDWAGAPAPAAFFAADGVHLSPLGSRARAAALASVLVSRY